MGLLGPFDGHPDPLEQGLRLGVRLPLRRVALGGPCSLQGGRWTWLPGCIATRRHTHVCRGPARRGSGNPGPNCRRAASIVSNTDLKVSALAESMSVLPPISSFCLPTGSGQLQGQTSPWPVPRVPNGRCLRGSWQAPGGSCLWHRGRIGFGRGKIDEGKGCGQCRRPWARRARLAGEETLQGQGLGQTQRRASPRCCRFSQHVSVGRLLAHPAGPRRLREGPADRPRQAILEVRRPQDLGAQVCCGNLHVQCHTQGHTPPTIRMQTYGKGQVVNGPGHTAGLCETGQDTKEPGHDGARGGGLCRARQTGQTEEGKTYITSKLGMTPSAVKQTGKTGKTWGSVSG